MNYYLSSKQIIVDREPFEIDSSLSLFLEEIREEYRVFVQTYYQDLSGES